MNQVQVQAWTYKCFWEAHLVAIGGTKHVPQDDELLALAAETHCHQEAAIC